MASRIQLRRGTAAQWTASNPILAVGEMGLETDTRKAKQGDGITPWVALGYMVAGAMDGSITDTSVAAGAAIAQSKIANLVSDLAGKQSSISPGTYAQGLVATAVKTGAYTATPKDYVLADTTGGAFTVTLPTAPPDGSRIGIKIVAPNPAVNFVTFACGGSDHINLPTGPTTGTVKLFDQGIVLQYATSTAVWTAQSSDLPLGQLDTRFAPLAFPAATSGSGKGITFDTSVANQKHVVGVNQQSFSGVIDNVLTLAVNGVVGSPGVRGVSTENFLQLGIESRWIDGLGRDQAEFNLDYINRDGTHAFRPMSWGSDTNTHVSGWNFRGTSWIYSSDTDDVVAKLTDAGVNIHGFRLSARTRTGTGYSYPAFQPLSTDVCRLIVMPKGNPGAGERSSVTAYGTDYQADTVNWQRVLLSANSDGGADLLTEKNGTGVAGSIYLHAGRVVEVKTDGKILMGNKLSLAGQAGGSVEVIDNAGSAFYTRLNAQNGTFRLFSGAHFGILDAGNATGIDLYHDGTASTFDTFSVTPISLRINGTEHARISAGADGETALMVRRNVGGTFSLQRVSMGAADSGGAGFKVLRVPN